MQFLLRSKVASCIFRFFAVYWFDLYPTNTFMEPNGMPEQNQPERLQPLQEALQRERTSQEVPASGSLKAGDVIATFDVLEGAPYTRSRRWMWSMLATVLVLLGVAFGFDGFNSITMAVAFIALIVVYGMTMRRADPNRRIPLIFTTYGLQLAGKFYPYSQFRYFYMLEFPGYIMLTVQSDARLSTGTELYLLPTDPIQEIRSLLQEYVGENMAAKETLIQRLVRMLQL